MVEENVRYAQFKGVYIYIYIYRCLGFLYEVRTYELSALEAWQRQKKPGQEVDGIL